MSKKWMIIAGVAAIAVVALVATFLLASPKSSSPENSTGATTVSSASTSTSSPSATTSVNTSGSVPSQGGKGSSSSQGNNGSNSSSNNGNNNSTPPKANGEGNLRPFPPLPDTGLPAVTKTVPASPGETLAPLAVEPKPVLGALKPTELFSRASFNIVMRPYGFGPGSIWGSGIVIRVDSATPVGKTPKYTKIVGANILAIAATTDGGVVVNGGTYNAVLTFRSDGKMLLPILSQAKLKQ